MEIIETLENPEIASDIPEILTNIQQLIETQNQYISELLNLMFWFIVAMAVISFLLLLYNILKKFIWGGPSYGRNR